MKLLNESTRGPGSQQWEEVETMEDIFKTCDAYLVVEYVASMPARQLYKIADVDGTIDGKNLYAAAMANPKTSVFAMKIFRNEIAATACQDKFAIEKQRNAHKITFCCVGKITLMWRDYEPAPFYPNDCPEDDEIGILQPRSDWQRYWVGGMTPVSTSLPHSISKEQWQRR